MSAIADRRADAIRTRNKPSTLNAPFQPVDEKGAAGGYAELDTGGTVPDAQIPDTVARDADISAETAARIAADTAEATTRANADTTESNARVAHQNLTTTAHGGLVASGDARLSDARTPTAHATSHRQGGTDQLRRTYTTKIANYNTTTSDDVIRVGLSPTITLHDPSTACTATEGQRITIVNVGAGVVTVANAFGGYSGTIAAGAAVTVMATLFSGTYLWDRIA